MPREIFKIYVKTDNGVLAMPNNYVSYQDAMWVAKALKRETGKVVFIVSSNGKQYAV